MDKDYNFSHQFYKKFIHNMVRKESETSHIQLVNANTLGKK